MPDIDDLTAATAVSPTDQLYVAQGVSDDRRATVAQLHGIPVPQVVTTTTLPLTAAHHRGTVILGPGGTITWDAAALGDGYWVKFINRTGTDWTVPTPTGGTLSFDLAGDTKLAAGASGGAEIYTYNSTRYVHIFGATL